MASPVTRPGPLREVLAVIQAELSGSVAGHVFSFAALGCLVVPGIRPVASALLALAGCSTQRVLCVLVTFAPALIRGFEALCGLLS